MSGLATKAPLRNRCRHEHGDGPCPRPDDGSARGPTQARPVLAAWLLRPAVPGSVVRLDETMAFFEDPASGSSGSTYVTSLIATWKASPNWVPIFREIWVEQRRTRGGQGSLGQRLLEPAPGRQLPPPVRPGLALLRLPGQHHPDRERRRRLPGRGGGRGHDRRDLRALGHGQRAVRRRLLDGDRRPGRRPHHPGVDAPGRGHRPSAHPRPRPGQRRTSTAPTSPPASTPATSSRRRSRSGRRSGCSAG